MRPYYSNTSTFLCFSERRSREQSLQTAWVSGLRPSSIAAVALTHPYSSSCSINSHWLCSVCSHIYSHTVTAVPHVNERAQGFIYGNICKLHRRTGVNTLSTIHVQHRVAKHDDKYWMSIENCQFLLQVKINKWGCFMAVLIFFFCISVIKNLDLSGIYLTGLNKTRLTYFI